MPPAQFINSAASTGPEDDRAGVMASAQADAESWHRLPNPVSCAEVGTDMLRIVERLFGEGHVLCGGTSVGAGGYSVSIYREWQAAGSDMVAGDFVIEGHLLLPTHDLERLLGASNLVLRLDDGRWFDFHLVSLDGAIANVDGRPLQAAGLA